jgi:hypothetical protein
MYRVTATFAGYVMQTKEVTVAQGADTWASFGLEQDAPPPPPPPPPPPDELDAAELIEETTDPILAAPGDRVEKTWKVRNTGNTTWNADYHLAFTGGESFGAPVMVPLTAEVPPEAEHTITLLLTSSTATGIYEGFWSLERDGLGPFGPPLDVEIIVQMDEPDPDPGLGPKDPPAMEQPMEMLAETDGTRVTGGCVSAGTPEGGALLLLLGLLTLRRRARGKQRVRSPSA